MANSRRLIRFADLSIFTISLDVISWLRGSPTGAVFIPVGANLPDSASENVGASEPVDAWRPRPGAIRIAVYGITGGATGSGECAEIVAALRLAAERGARLALHAFGRGAEEHVPGGMVRRPAGRASTPRRACGAWLALARVSSWRSRSSWDSTFKNSGSLIAFGF